PAATRLLEESQRVPPGVHERKAGSGPGALGVEGPRSLHPATGPTCPDGAQPQRVSGRVPRGRAIPDAPAPAPALVLYTSGSTGRPKGAVLSHAALKLANESWAGPDMELTTSVVDLRAMTR